MGRGREKESTGGRGGRREGERERETELICGSTYLCIHLLFLVCALAGERTIEPATSAYRDDAVTN